VPCVAIGRDELAVPDDLLVGWCGPITLAEVDCGINLPPARSSAVSTFGADDVAGITAAPHDLRHTLATMLREQGHDLSTIAEILGHASIEITQRYTLPSQAETAAALENLTIDI
jgi:hypothetical protein